MKIGINTQTITSLPKKALNGVNELGSHVTGFAKSSADKFIKNGTVQKIGKGISKRKDTIAGAAVILAAIGSAVTLAATIKNKVDESKNILKDK